jgi:hypothetical protein
MARDAETLLREAREELYAAKTIARSLRNSSKTLAAALHDSELRIDALLDEIEDPQRQEAQGHDEKHRTEALQ